MLVSLAVATTADAKKPKDDPTATPTTTAPATAPAEITLTIAQTGIADVDNVFNKAVDPLKTVNDTKTALDNLNKNLNQALGLADTGSLADAINDLKTKANGKITWR